MSTDTPPPAPPAPRSPGVSIVVIAYNDVAHVAEAVRSALSQGRDVAEVIAVDDASTDGTGAVLDDLARVDDRLRVLHRTTNSGGCGTPRNEGLRAARAPYVMFLDSDDVLAPGAVRTLLDAARRHDVPVVAGACVRRELPQRHDVRWQPTLFRREAVYERPLRPSLVRDTLCVNKLYSRDFLTAHAITFPTDIHYEDFVFQARVLTAAPRVAVVPQTVYVWHVRRGAPRPSISLRRDHTDNWRDRITAHRRAVAVFEEAGADPLARAARVKFLDLDLRMYLRELPQRDPEYRATWWRLARAYLATFPETELREAPPAARWLARFLLAADQPRDLTRAAQLAARPARLVPPYAADPVWADDLPAPLDGVEDEPLQRLPFTVDARFRGNRLQVRLHDLYGRLARCGVFSLDLELRHRDSGYAGQMVSTVPRLDGASYTAELRLDFDALADRCTPGRRVDVWDLRMRVSCENGRYLRAALRPVGPRPRRAAVPSRRHGLLLVQPYTTHGGSLALRLAPGARGLLGVGARRVRRLTSAYRRAAPVGAR